LDYYNIDLSGKKAVIVGRSMVVGKPLSMLLLGKNATVTICHTKTKDLSDECRKADILIACAGKAKMITSLFTNPSQIIIDVGINFENNKLCGDVNFEEVAENIYAITPVPGGVGTVTTSVLLKHTIISAERL
jgi:methylenetetrahydrofolate dehydrogenase (NADP+)/methenyltetrahydrofolate cyclohydrolase